MCFRRGVGRGGSQDCLKYQREPAILKSKKRKGNHDLATGLWWLSSFEKLYFKKSKSMPPLP